MEAPAYTRPPYCRENMEESLCDLSQHLKDSGQL